MIGILGGTFDPVHHGHLRVATEIRELFGLDQLRLLPCGRPAHRDEPEASAEQRVELLNLAVQDDDWLSVDCREMRRSGPSYMIDTLISLRRETAGTPLLLALGTDAFMKIRSWHRWDELADYTHLAVVARPGFEIGEQASGLDPAGFELTRDPAAIRRSAAGKLIFFHCVQLDISSSDIRWRINQGRSPRYLLPDRVLRCIEQKALYR